MDGMFQRRECAQEKNHSLSLPDVLGRERQTDRARERGRGRERDCFELEIFPSTVDVIML